MSTVLPLLVAVGLVIGLAIGFGLGRQQNATRDERELSRAREELAKAERDVALARAEAAEARTGAAEGEAMVAHVRAQVARAEAERDAARTRVEEIVADRQAMVDQFRMLSSETAERQGKQVDALTSQRLQATQELLTPVAATLQQFQARLVEVEKERVTMARDLQGHVRSVRDTGEALRRETASLVTALRKPQVRGAWGETQLKRVAEMSGMIERCDFDVQLTSQSDGQTLRPDMRVHLAEGKYVFVDSKVPLSAFLDAAETDDERQRAAHMASFARHVRAHVDQLSGKKYWKLGESPEFVVLFLPAEAFYAAALEQLPDLNEYAAQRDVVLATPSTLIALLRTVGYGWKQAALAETAAEVFRVGRELHDRLGQMGNRFDKLGRALRTSVNAYNETIATVEGRVLVQARRFRDLKVTENELDGLASIDEPVRQIQAPELVDDATQVEPMVGRTRRRREEPPEAEALFRSDPTLDELVTGQEPLDGGDATEQTGS